MSDSPILLVKNLPYDASTALLYDLFSKYGKIHQLRVSDGSVSLGSCYVVYYDKLHAQRAAKGLSGLNFHSRYLVALIFQANEETLRSADKS